MITKIKIYSLLVLTLAILSCQKNNYAKDFGKWESVKDNLRVDIDLNNFNTLQQLLDRINEIACNDSFPSIKIENRKRIYLINHCTTGIISCGKMKNVFELENDSIKKRWLKFPLDSLENVLRRDYFNNERNYMFSDRPNKLIFRISTDSTRFNNLINKLDLITDIYEQVTDSTDIKIEISKIKRKPPPPPPDFDIDKI